LRRSGKEFRAPFRTWWVKDKMYFAVMILIALVVVAAVLILEHRGDPRALEREYKLWRTHFKDKKR
jgi:hypothetical protein